MFDTLPRDAREVMDWDWDRIEPYFNALQAQPLTAENIADWLADWTHLADLLSEMGTRIYVATTVNTADEEAEKRFTHYLDTLYPKEFAANQQLNLKLVDSGLQPENFEVPLRRIKAEVEIYREENIPLQAEIQKLGQEYDKIVGAQTIEWEGDERTLPQVTPIYQDPDRDIREKAWRQVFERRLQDRPALNDLWQRLLSLRTQIAANAGFDNFRDYQWKSYKRFAYTPEDCFTFHRAIEEVVVPAAARLYERRRQRLGLERLRPWDTMVDPTGEPPLRPFAAVDTLMDGCETIFNKVDPQLGEYFATMRHEALLDLENRKNKAPGGYCTSFDIAQRPFIFMNAVGIHGDVQTLLHESGHSFHVFETAQLPYTQQRMEDVPIEFAEVASMTMELLTAPYLTKEQGGFYTEREAARARVEHLEDIITFWPYMAVVDAFQHWVYENPEAAKDPAACDAQWLALWNRFIKGIDWSGLEEFAKAGWQHKLHIYQVPFYYIEYGLAQLGAVQIWRNALGDQPAAIEAYRNALALGSTATLPDLFAAAGARFVFDSDTLRAVVDLVEKTIAELDPA
ncbi:MAG: M3 family oligoendopeptidase [Chloroflexi bacterium]|nr:M3 family oligoendopeptidase [Chloroflexota bacterium]